MVFIVLQGKRDFYIFLHMLESRTPQRKANRQLITSCLSRRFTMTIITKTKHRYKGVRIDISIITALYLPVKEFSLRRNGDIKKLHIRVLCKNADCMRLRLIDQDFSFSSIYVRRNRYISSSTGGHPFREWVNPDVQLPIPSSPVCQR